MLHPRGPAGRATVTGAALCVVMALVTTGCGGSSGTASEDGPDAKTASCRGEWKDLGKSIQGNDSKTNPSALAPRWNNVVATIEYYSSSAKSSDCDEAIDKQRDAIAALTNFGTRLAPYDMELRLDQVREDAETYAKSPPPPKPTPSPTPKNKKKKKQKKAKPPPAPPSPAQVSAALKALTAQAPLATQQQGPGWQQARVVELSDAAAVAKAVNDLGFLSTESPSYRASRALLAKIKVALKGTTK